jgi:hypothetical protein
MTLGPAILFLAFTENINNAASKAVSIYGRVPMFYYVIHIFLIHLITMVAAGLFTDFSWKVWILKEPLWFTQELKGYGFSLGIVTLFGHQLLSGYIHYAGGMINTNLPIKKNGGLSICKQFMPLNILICNHH